MSISLPGSTTTKKNSTTHNSGSRCFVLTHIQRIDASYQIIYALDLRITIQTMIATTTAHHDNYVLEVPSEDEIRIFFTEQYLVT